MSDVPSAPPTPQQDPIGSLLAFAFNAIQLFPAKNEASNERLRRYVAIGAVGLGLLQQFGIVPLFKGADPAQPAPPPAYRAPAK